MRYTTKKICYRCKSLPSRTPWRIGEQRDLDEKRINMKWKNKKSHTLRYMNRQSMSLRMTIERKKRNRTYDKIKSLF